MKKAALAITLLLLTLASFAWAGTPAPDGADLVVQADEQPSLVFGADGTMRLVTVVAGGDADAEPGDIEPLPSGPCNEGQCVTAAGVVLNCPKTGGPSCNSSQECVCDCTTGRAKNMCI